MSTKQDEVIAFPGAINNPPVLEQGKSEGVLVPGYYLVPPEEQMTQQQVESLHKVEKDLWKVRLSLPSAN
jgi:hypothetical protein